MIGILPQCSWAESIAPTMTGRTNSLPKLPSCKATWVLDLSFDAGGVSQEEFVVFMKWMLFVVVGCSYGLITFHFQLNVNFMRLFS